MKLVLSEFGDLNSVCINPTFGDAREMATNDIWDELGGYLGLVCHAEHQVWGPLLSMVEDELPLKGDR